MSSGMQWVDTSDLQRRFSCPLLCEVEGDRSDLAGPLCEVVDVQADDIGRPYTILHVPGGQLPVPVRRAMGIVYEPATA